VDKQSITYLDSLGCDGKDVLKNILHYLKDEHLDKKQNPLPNAWTLLSPDVPQQTNGNDCGVFVCAFAFHLSIGMSVIGIRQSDMDKWRNKILDDIIHFWDNSSIKWGKKDAMGNIINDVDGLVEAQSPLEETLCSCGKE
jgi:Ulp1 family protease